MIEVIQVAPMCTVQDLGRRGWRHLGVSQTGAMDTLAMQQANMLVGNTPGAAVLEFSHAPLQLRLHSSRHVALMGAGHDAQWLDGTNGFQRLPTGFACLLPAGAVLHVRRPAAPGLRGYLAIAGGIAVPAIMGSRSTDINNGFGGWQGRPLRAGDQLPLAEPPTCPPDCRRGIRPLPRKLLLRALPGPEHEQFPAPSRALFWQQRWPISVQSNRMGLRLAGRHLDTRASGQQLSSPVLPGVVQVPDDGQPIILANDAQTTGGYARIAVIIEADLWRLAYLLPGDRVEFQQVGLAAARLARQRQRQFLLQQAQSLRGTQSQDKTDVSD